MIDEPALTPDRSDVTNSLRFLILLRKLPLRHSVSAFVSAAVGCHTIFIARNKEACCQSRQSKVASSKLTV